MKVTREHKPDSRGWPDNDFILYHFYEGGDCLIGRQFDGSLDEAHFLNLTDSDNNIHTFDSIPYELPLFTKALNYFQDEHGVHQFNVLVFTERGVSPTWEPVEYIRQ